MSHHVYTPCVKCTSPYIWFITSLSECEKFTRSALNHKVWIQCLHTVRDGESGVGVEDVCFLCFCLVLRETLCVTFYFYMKSAIQIKCDWLIDVCKTGSHFLHRLRKCSLLEWNKGTQNCFFQATVDCCWRRGARCQICWISFTIRASTFFTSRETTGTGQLPDLIRLKDIQTDRLGEASDPLRFNLFGSITAGWSLVDTGWKHERDASFTWQ